MAMPLAMSTHAIRLPASIFSGLVDDGDFADGSFLSVTGGGHHHIDTRCHPVAVQVATVPGEGATVTGALCHQSPVGGDDFHVGVHRESYDGDKTRIVGSDGVGIGIDIVLRHRLVGGGGVAHIGAKAIVGTDKHLAGLVVDGDGLDIVGKQFTVGRKEVLHLSHVVGTDEIDAVAIRAKPFSVAAIDGDAGDIDAAQQVVGKVGSVIAGYLHLLQHRVGTF